MTEDAAHSDPWKISDVVIFPGLALGGLAEWLRPTSLGLPDWLGWGLRLGLVLGGFALIQWSKRTLDAYAQPSLPGTPTTELVTNGAFARSRNPNYLGALMAVMGAAVLFGSL